MCGLGLIYRDGDNDIEKDVSKAVQYFETAAAKGSAEGKDYLGNCYRFGDGVAVNLEKAVRLYNEATQDDYAPAKSNLAECYFDGTGVQKNDKQGVYLSLIHIYSNAEDEYLSTAYTRSPEQFTPSSNDMTESCCA